MNGCLAPLLIGTAVGTFFTGSEFIVNKDAITDISTPIISRWVNEWHGLEAVTNLFNVGFGLTVMMLTICLGALYAINNIDNHKLSNQLRRTLMWSFTGFVVLLLSVLFALFTMNGYAVDESGTVLMEPNKYLHNLMDMPAVAALFVAGALLLVAGVVLTLVKSSFTKGIWPAGVGTVSVVMSLFMIAGYNGTAYYPSTTDLQSSLTIQNSSSSEFTLMCMSVVSLIIPCVVAYIAYFWYKMDKKSITNEELKETESY